MGETRGRGRPKNKEESVTALSDYKKSSKLVANNSEEISNQISDIVSSRMIMFDEVCKRGKVNLHDAEQVESVVIVYLDNCRKLQLVPTFEGLAFSLGYSRRYLYKIIKEGRYETADLFDRLRTLFADITQTASSKKLVDNATAIFILKSMTGMGFSDHGEAPDEVEAEKDDILSYDELIAKYGHLIED